MNADLLHGIGVPRKYTALFNKLMQLDEANRQTAGNEGQHKEWKQWRCDPTIGEGILHLYEDTAYSLYKLHFALEQLHISPPVWTDPGLHWESVVMKTELRLQDLPEEESRYRVAQFLVGRPDALVL